MVEVDRAPSGAASERQSFRQAFFMREVKMQKPMRWPSDFPGKHDRQDGQSEG